MDSCHGSNQTLTHHPQVGQGKQRMPLRSVLGRASVAHLHMPELAFDDAERVFDLGADTRLDTLDLIGKPIHWILVQSLPQTWPLGHMPLHFGLGNGALGNALIARITKHVELIAMQQAVSFNDIVDVAPSCHARCEPGQTRYPHQCEPSCRSTTGCPFWTGASRDRVPR